MTREYFSRYSSEGRVAPEEGYGTGLHASRGGCDMTPTQLLASRILADLPTQTPGAIRLLVSGLTTVADSWWELTRTQAGVLPPSKAADRHLGVSLETRREVVALIESLAGLREVAA